MAPLCVSDARRGGKSNTIPYVTLLQRVSGILPMSGLTVAVNGYETRPTTKSAGLTIPTAVESALAAVIRQEGRFDQEDPNAKASHHRCRTARVRDCGRLDVRRERAG